MKSVLDPLRAALLYLLLGWRVFPVHGVTEEGKCACQRSDCASPGKHPRARHWLADATLDEAQVRRWWPDGSGHNLGVATGGAARLLVVDIDPRHGGDESLAQLEAAHGALPSTVVALTGGGGQHLVFQAPEGVRIGNSTNLAGHRGVDIRGDGGYIVAPPSIHASGQAYRWREGQAPGEMSLASAPAWLVALLTKPLHEVKTRGDAADDRVIPEGERHNTLLKLAYSLRARGLSEEGLTAALLAESEARCQPPYPERDVRNIATWVSATFDPGGGGDGGERVVTTAKALVDELLTSVPLDVAAPFQATYVQALACLASRAPAEYERLRPRFKGAGVALARLDAAVKQQARVMRKAKLRVLDPNETPPVDVIEHAVPGLPVQGLVTPQGYYVRPDATGFVRFSDGEREEIPLAPGAVVITRRLKDIEQNTESLELAWTRPDGLQRTVVEREIVMDHRKLPALAAQGFLVDSGNAKGMVAYLSRFEAVNYMKLPRLRVSSRLGWQGPRGDPTKFGFLCGRSQVRPDGTIVSAVADDLPAGQPDADVIVFRGLSGGDEQLADGFHSAGTIDGWKGVVALLRAYPRPLMALYASFVPPLLPILRVPNFVVDLAQRTSTGKTSSARAAGSVWGCPDEHLPESVVRSWDATNVFIERACAVVSGMPLILDEAKRVRRPEAVAQVLYAVAHGQGRGRGNPRGLARTRTWQTMVLSTGESAITAVTQDGGTRGRVVVVRGMPFGVVNDETRRVVDALNVGVTQHYGHAGVAFVQWLVRHRSDWDQFCEMYAETRRTLLEQAPAGAAGRLAAYAAAIEVAGALAHAALQLSWPWRSPLDALWTQIAEEADDASGGARALRYVHDWALSQEHRFHGRACLDPNGDVRSPSAGWLGRWDPEEDWRFVGIFEPEVRKYLLSHGFHPDGILAEWRERGWIECDQRHYTTKKYRVAGICERLVAITRAAVDEVLA